MTAVNSVSGQDYQSAFLRASGGILTNSEITEIVSDLFGLNLDPGEVASKIKNVTYSPDGKITIKTDDSTITYKDTVTSVAASQPAATPSNSVTVAKPASVFDDEVKSQTTKTQTYDDYVNSKINEYYKDKDLIDGSYGPYDTTTPEGQGANAGFAIAELTKSGFSVFEKDIKYASSDDKEWSVDSSLAFSHEALKTLDSNGNSVVDKDDDYWANIVSQYKNINIVSQYKNIKGFNPALLTNGELDKTKIFNQFDLNDDDKIDEAEYASFLRLQDVIKGENYRGTLRDGIITPDEREMTFYMLLSPLGDNILNNIFEKNKCKEALEKFKMPEKNI